MSVYHKQRIQFPIQPIKRRSSQTNDLGKKWWKCFLCSRSRSHSQCVHFKLSVRELSCSTIEKTLTVSVPADHVKCSLKCLRLIIVCNYTIWSTIQRKTSLIFDFLYTGAYKGTKDITLIKWRPFNACLVTQIEPKWSSAEHAGLISTWSV